MVITVDAIASLLGNEVENVIICMETATSMQNLSNMYMTNEIDVYCSRQLNIKGVNCIVISDITPIECEVINGLKCTTKLRTIKDLLDTAYERDYQTICETLSNYYYKHGQSFEKLEEQLNEKQRLILEEFKQDAIEYYDD